LPLAQIKLSTTGAAIYAFFQSMRRGAEIEALVSADIYPSGAYLPRLKFPKVQGETSGR
jgi:hypothetical protein